mgnify:FL=1
MTSTRRRFTLWLAGLLPLLAACRPSPMTPASATTPEAAADRVPLPAPSLDSGPPLTQVLAERRSVREYGIRPLTDAEVGQLAWAAQGVTNEVGYRTAPSAGATYPLDLYLARQDGLYRYLPTDHALLPLRLDDVRPSLATGGLDQECLKTAPVVFILTATPGRSSPRYGDRAERYVRLEAGHACQSLLLQACGLGLGAVPVGAFDDADIARTIGLPNGEESVYLVPVGPRA